jgi:mannose-6-phosphate isomerase-like protein (cupin superfamily)
MGTALLSFENKIPDLKPARFVNFRGSLIKFHADSTDTSGQFALLEMKGGAGGEPPLHVHRNEDELFYILEGHLKVLRGNEEITLNPGQSAFLPRNVAHTFKDRLELRTLSQLHHTGRLRSVLSRSRPSGGRECHKRRASGSDSHGRVTSRSGPVFGHVHAIVKAGPPLSAASVQLRLHAGTALVY